MLHLVEGLNGAGKTTYIDQMVGVNPEIAHRLHTTWLNPKREIDSIFLSLNGIRSEIDAQLSSILTMSYITIAHTIKQLSVVGVENHIYMDRSWISGYIYGSISYSDYNLLVEQYNNILGYGWDVIWINTPIDICKSRYNANRPYVENLKWDDAYHGFVDTMKDLKDRAQIIKEDK